jgi:hypothetical protein
MRFWFADRDHFLIWVWVAATVAIPPLLTFFR